ncbi:MAG TPA: hypothetical protein VM238_04820 [Phycisphaerae bacterium]|nr:hypothetical protein [Phycisphaerae bacterium]
MRYTTWLSAGAFLAATGLACVSDSRDHSSVAVEQTARQQSHLFGELCGLGWPDGEGQVEFQRRAMVVKCRQSGLPSVVSKLNTFRPTALPRFDVAYEFVFDRAECLRLNFVLIDTTLAAVPACANVPHEVKREHEPRPKALLEYEVLLSSCVPAADSRARSEVMVRSRMIRLFDDADTGYMTLDGDSWLSEAPIFAPRGMDSAQAGTVCQRCWYRAWPWVYTIIQVPADSPIWWPQYLRRIGYLDEPATVTLAHGYYTPLPQEWSVARRTTP